MKSGNLHYVRCQILRFNRKMRVFVPLSVYEKRIFYFYLFFYRKG